MTTSFSSLLVIDVDALKAPFLSANDARKLSKQLYDVFATTGFAYLINVPLSFDHEQMFGLAREFFSISADEKMRLAKRSFRPRHSNTYRGYFPTQPHLADDNLKEGFEIGNPINSGAAPTNAQKIILSEPNVWPDKNLFSKKEQLEQAYNELQMLSSQLLSLLAISLGKKSDFFSSWLEGSLSTLRLLHYPPLRQPQHMDQDAVILSCTQHTDSGILTLLHQDATGGLEVLNASNEWIPAPYVPGSIVVNIGDLMSTVSGGRFTATMHRVRTPPSNLSASKGSPGRFSIPFFFEPGETCVITPVDGNQESVVYGDHLRKKMATWVEFQDDSGYDTNTTEEI